MSVPARTRTVTNLRGEGRMLLAQRALHPEHNPVQQSKALLRLARTDEVQITVGWEDRWQTLSENHLPRIIAIFIQENPEIIRLSGGSSHSGGDIDILWQRCLLRNEPSSNLWAAV